MQGFHDCCHCGADPVAGHPEAGGKSDDHHMLCHSAFYAADVHALVPEGRLG